jgi:hypothetical protein
MDKNKICLHQWIKPDNKTNIKGEGMGDCRTCIPHEDNKKCRCYCEITAPQEFEVE